MKLRRGSLQLVVLLLTLATNEPWGIAQPVPPTTGPSPGGLPPGTSTATLGGTAQDILKAASKGKTILGVLVTDGNAPLLGFKNRAEASSVELGTPLLLYWVDLLLLRGYGRYR